MFSCLKHSTMKVTELDEILGAQTIKSENISEDYVSTGEIVSEDPLDMGHFGTEPELGDDISVPLPNFCESEDDDNDAGQESDAEVIVQIMDIRTRLSKLRSMLEQRLCTDLTGYTFWLQDAKMLENHKTLVEQCVRGEGEVQVNLQIKSSQKKINILDVLKPDEEMFQLADERGTGIVADILDSPVGESYNLDDLQNIESSQDAVDVLHAAAFKWVVDEQFKKDQERLKIPSDPAQWTVQHVRLWVQWAVRHFKLHGIKLHHWNITGQMLVELTHKEFKEKVPNDPGDIFWTHFELLRKCKFVVVQSEDHFPQNAKAAISPQSLAVRKKPKLHVEAVLTEEEITNMAVMRESNGQIQLWQFLLDLLTNAQYTKLICWEGNDGEFKLLEPEKVARLWGIRKNKPTMNYEKLSRALRYYYDGEMIAKVGGKRFVYKFVCNLRHLIGFDASELAELVNETYESMQGRNITEYIF